MQSTPPPALSAAWKKQQFIESYFLIGLSLSFPPSNKHKTRAQQGLRDMGPLGKRYCFQNNFAWKSVYRISVLYWMGHELRIFRYRWGREALSQSKAWLLESGINDRWILWPDQELEFTDGRFLHFTDVFARFCIFGFYLLLVVITHYFPFLSVAAKIWEGCMTNKTRRNGIPPTTAA